MMPFDPFTPTGLTEIEKNADLALYLLDFLDEACDPHERIWRGDRDMRTLQYTSHVVEALQALDIQGVTDSLIMPAARWLSELQFGYPIPPEEFHALRIYPSRFKALAVLGRIDSAGLRNDYIELSRLVDENTGWIHDAPLTLNATLITLIWFDVAIHLGESHHWVPDLEAKRERVLRGIHDAFQTWVDQASELIAQGRPLPDRPLRQPGEIVNPGDASYAVDLLLRSGMLPPDSALAERGHQALVSTIKNRRLGDMRRTDLLYCSLHLRAHFPHHSETSQIIESFIAELRDRYQNRECQREPVSFHALVLRLLRAHHGDGLRGAMLEKRWTQTRQALVARREAEQQQTATEFERIVRRSLNIRLSRLQHITGTPTRGEVYRVRFGLKTEATDEDGKSFSVPRDSLSLIVKKGPLEMLQRAVERYRDLPEPLQRWFTRHADVKEGEGVQTSSGYLLMQDLAGMQPLAEVLAHFDRPLLRRAEHEQIGKTVGAVTNALHALHSYSRQPNIVSRQFELIYVAPIVDCLNLLCQPRAFPQLKQWLEGSVVVNGVTYRKFDWYLKRLQEAQLRPHDLGYVHGDCHSRNLMLDATLSQAKFVDIETLTKPDDYVLDYGLLIEDVAVYLSLPRREENGRIGWDDIQTRRPDNVDSTLDNWIVYPAFPQSEAILFFQRELMGRLQEFALARGDKNWKERLWLSIARGLLMLAARQLASYSLEPKRRQDGLKLVQVAYTEALRLIHQLVESIESKGNAPLPELPFPGEHPAAQRPDEVSEPPLVSQLVQSIQQTLGDMVDWRQSAEASYFIDYYTLPERRLFARIHKKRNAPILYLACRIDQLDDPDHLAQPVEEGELRVRILLTSTVRMPAILNLTQQAYRLVHLDGGP